jgi:tartrate-resistant acid phosphatase type 5
VPEFHAEPYLHLAELTHNTALITWGAFYFKTRSNGSWKIVEDHDLRYVHPPRRESIGARSAPYGPAQVNVFADDGSLVATAATDTTNFCWIRGLQPNTRYRYEVIVNGEHWGQDERWDWAPQSLLEGGSRERAEHGGSRGSGQRRTEGLVQRGGRYVNEFRTHPDPTRELDSPLAFIVFGDYGTGIRRSTATRRQREVALAIERVFQQRDVRFIITAGDNIYAGTRVLGLPIGTNTGDEDDDWFFTFFQPYRYLINRVPVYPCIGNHDAGETEDHDDREQLMDNMYLRERFAAEEPSGGASLDPGLFYRFRYSRDVEFICLDTSKEQFFRGRRLFEYPKHREWIERALASNDERWRIAFCHHPPFCAGPQHSNTDRMQALLPLFSRGGVRVVFSGHEHNFQHASHDGIDYFITGAGSKVRKGAPDKFDSAHTRIWSDHAHFLLVTIDGSTMVVEPIGELIDDKVREVPRFSPEGTPLDERIVISR